MAKKQTSPFTVDEKVLQSFNENASNNSLNKSAWIEKQMMAYNDQCARYEALENNKDL